MEPRSPPPDPAAEPPSARPRPDAQALPPEPPLAPPSGASGPAPGLAATPLRTALGMLKPLWAVLLLALVLVAAAAAGVRWMLLNEAGSRWLLAHAPYVRAEGFEGALLGQSWRIERLTVRWSDTGSVQLDGVAADGLRFSWRPVPGAWLGIRAAQLRARELTVRMGPGSDKPATLPGRVWAPLLIEVDEAELATLRIGSLRPMSGLRADGFVWDPQDGARHRVRAAVAEGWGTRFRGAGSIDHHKPFAFELQASAEPAAATPGAPWQAEARATGTLEQFALQARLRGASARPRAEAPALDLRARIAPLARWKLPELDLQTEALDLSALLPQAPKTLLAGRARLGAAADAGALQAVVELDNRSPGRWDERRLPIARLSLAAAGDARQRHTLRVERFEAQLADAAGAAGRVNGSGTWQADRLQLEATLAGVAPQRLDGRAPGMLLAGPVKASVAGLPGPDPLAPAVPQAPGTAPKPPRVELELDLQGRVEASPVPVRLVLSGSAEADRVRIERARAEAGNAVADFRATLERGARAPWQLATAGTLSNFDPLPWWPGPAGAAGSAWRKGGHRLSGSWQVELRLPAGAETLPPLTLVQRLAGNGQVDIAESMLAGVPLAAQLRLAYAPAARLATPARARLTAQLGDNTFELEGVGDPLGRGDDDRLRAELKAERLATLAPLAALSPALAAWVPRQGAATASASAEGRWPEMRTEGTLRIGQLAAGPLTLARAQAQWRLDTRGDPGSAPLTLSAELAGASWAGVAPGSGAGGGAGGADTRPAARARADHLALELSGTLASHRLQLSGAGPVLPPAGLEQLLGLRADSGTRVLLHAEGAWRPEAAPSGLRGAAGGGRWLGRVERLAMGSWDGNLGQAPPAELWAEARDLRVALAFDAQHRLARLSADPGRIDIARQLAMRWDAVDLDFTGPSARIRLDADLEPFGAAPLLARLMPAMGWRGDLRLGARLRIRAEDRFEADVAFERAGGDLQANTGGVPTALGLAELKLAIAARDGQWTFTPLMRGAVLGEISGQVRASTTPEARWPTPDALLSGDIAARVADVGIWAPWVPPGWRLVGQLQTEARLSGRFGDPRFTGELRGSQLGARNLLQGVEVRDGNVLVRLEGETAQVERFVLKAGEGELRVSGGATLGANPAARLVIVAERFRALGRVDRLLTASGRATLELTRERLQLDGAVKADEAYFDARGSEAPSLDDDVTVRRPGTVRADDTPAAAPRTPMAVQIGLDLDVGERARFKGFGVDTGLAGKLRLTSPGGRMALAGTIQAVDGRYEAYAQKLEVERGVLAFNGPVNDPRLDVLAIRPNLDVRVGVAIAGPLTALRVRLYSQPDMSDTDKLSWLMLGRAPEGLGRNDTALLQRAALAILAGERSEAPVDAFLRNLGIDELSLRQSEGDVRETVVSIGKQLSRRWFVGYERGVNATTGTWQLTYRIAQRFTLRAQSGLENALDVIWVWRTQETPADAGMRKSTAVPRR